MHTFEQAQAMRYYRQRFSEMPVGDAMNGAAYGEYLKSKGIGAIIGVVAAVAAVWTGGATLAAYAAAGSTVGLGAAISAGAMVAGGVMSGVGIVTGNKKLTKIGGILSLAGGVGAMAFGTSAGAGFLGKEAHQAGNLSSLTGASTEAQASLMSEVANASKTANAVANSDAWAGQLDISAAPASTTPIDQTARAAELSSAEIGGSASTTTATEPTTMSRVAGAEKTAAAVDPALSIDAAPPQAPAAQSTPAPAAGGSKDVITPSFEEQTAEYMKNAYKPPKSEGFFTEAGQWMEKNKVAVEAGGKLLDSAGKMVAGGMAEGAEGGEDLQNAKAVLYEAQATAANATARNTDTVTEAQKQKMAAEEQQRKNANTQILMLDPRDPEYARKKAEAAAKGIPTMDMVTPAAGPVTMGNVDYTKSANQWVPDRPAQQPQGILQTAQR